MELKKGESVKLNVEKLVNEGCGLAKYENFPVFIDKVCGDDVVTAKIVSVNKSYAKAVVEKIEEPSIHRIQPFCALHNVCGGCQWQFIDYKQQLKEKQEIVRETVQKISGLDIKINEVIASPENQQYRHKIQMPVQQTKNSKRFLIGYYKENSHEIINIKHCAIQPEYINEIVDYIRQQAEKYGVTAYNEYRHKGELRHLVFRASQTNKNCVVIFVVNAQKVSPALKKLALDLKLKFDEILGVCVNYNDKRTNTIMTSNMSTLTGQDFYKEAILGIEYQISAGSFFQVNPLAAAEIFQTVKEIISKKFENENKPTVLDTYCGVGTLGLTLKDIAKEIFFVEENKSSINDLKKNIELNKIENAQVFLGDAKQILEQFKNENKKFDVIILDPPRKGCSKEALDSAIVLSNKYIIYVSCNPATLARDLKYLDENGYSADFIQPVDMFSHTHHIECIAVLERC